MKGEEGMDINKKSGRNYLLQYVSMVQKRKGSVQRKVDVDIGQTRQTIRPTRMHFQSRPEILTGRTVARKRTSRRRVTSGKVSPGVIRVMSMFNLMT